MDDTKLSRFTSEKSVVFQCLTQQMNPWWYVMYWEAVTELLVHGLAQRLAVAGMSFPPASHLLSLVICAWLAELSSGLLLARCGCWKASEVVVPDKTIVSINK